MFDRIDQLALMQSAYAGSSAGQDTALFRSEFRQTFRISVIHEQGLIFAKRAILMLESRILLIPLVLAFFASFFTFTCIHTIFL